MKNCWSEMSQNESDVPVQQKCEMEYWVLVWQKSFCCNVKPFSNVTLDFIENIFLLNGQNVGNHLIQSLVSNRSMSHLGAHFLHWNQNSKFWVTWPRITQSVYFLMETFWIIKFTIMFFFLTFTHEIFHVRSSTCLKTTIPSKKYTNWAKLSHFWLMNVKKTHNCEFNHSKLEK